jgi:hypothetical protein
MAPDGQVRLQASGIRLDHSLLSLVSEGEAKCPLAHAELFEPFFAAGVTRRRLCDGSGIEQRGRQRWPHVGMQRSALRCVRGRACAGLASRGVAGRAQPRTSSIAQLGERLRARQEVRVEVRKLRQYVWAGQRHPSRRPGSSRCRTVASRGDGTSSRRARRCRISRGASRCCPRGGRGGGVGRGCRTGRARRRNRSCTAPGAAAPAARRSGRRPGVDPETKREASSSHRSSAATCRSGPRSRALSHWAPVTRSRAAHRTDRETVLAHRHVDDLDAEGFP